MRYGHAVAGQAAGAAAGQAPMGQIAASSRQHLRRANSIMTTLSLSILPRMLESESMSLNRAKDAASNFRTGLNRLRAMPSAGKNPPCGTGFCCRPLMASLHRGLAYCRHSSPCRSRAIQMLLPEASSGSVAHRIAILQASENATGFTGAAKAEDALQWQTAAHVCR